MNIEGRPSSTFYSSLRSILPLARLMTNCSTLLVKLASEEMQHSRGSEDEPECWIQGKDTADECSSQWQFKGTKGIREVLH